MLTRSMIGVLAVGSSKAARVDEVPIVGPLGHLAVRIFEGRIALVIPRTERNGQHPADTQIAKPQVTGTRQHAPSRRKPVMVSHDIFEGTELRGRVWSVITHAVTSRRRGSAA